MKLSNIVAGFRRDKLVVLYRIAEPRFGRPSVAHAVVQCDCGNVKKVLAADLKRDGRHSCGCARGEFHRERLTTHDQSKTALYRRWRNILSRCEDSNCRIFKFYGGRGIKVCERWHSFENFVVDMGYPPPGLSIDRIDVNGDYTPENCRWATDGEQGANRTDNRVLTIGGESLHLAEAARRYGIKREALAYRLKRGMSAAEAVSKLVRILRGAK